MIERNNIDPVRDPEGNMRFDFDPMYQWRWLIVTKAEAMEFFDLVEREPAAAVDPAQAELPIDCNPVDAFIAAARVLYPDLEHDTASINAARAYCEQRPIRSPVALGAPYGGSAMPQVEKDITLIDDTYLDQALAAPEGRLCLAYTARLNQYESAYGVAATTISARIDCLRRAMLAEGIK